MVALLSCHPTLPDRAPLSSYREGNKVKVLKYDQALRGLREVVEKLGRKPRDFAFHPRSRGRRIRSGYPERRGVEIRCVQDVYSEQ